MNETKLLPIGSIVLLKGGRKRLMIYGRKQLNPNSATIWDYIGCYYPEGNLNAEHTFLFNHDQIKRVDFIGFQDDEEHIFLERLLKELESRKTIENI